MKTIFVSFKQKSLLLFLMLMFCSFAGGDDDLLYRHYVTALSNRSDFQNFLVVRVADMSKNEVREFCTLGFFLRNALHREWKIDYDELSVKLVEAKARMNHPRLFEFKNPEAIQYLGMDLYTPAELAALEKEVDFKKLAKQIKSFKQWRMEFRDNDKLMRMYAHALFNQGILTGENLDTGEALEYVP